MVLSASRATAAPAYTVAPHIRAQLIGYAVENVTVEAYGVIRPATVMRYLSIRRGAHLTQSAVDRDYANLVRLGALRVRLNVLPGIMARSVRLRWIVLSKWLKSTTHPFYGDTPLSAPIQGVGFVLTAPPLDDRGTAFSAYTQLSKRANLARILFTAPLRLDPAKGRAQYLVADAYGARGVYRASQPYAINVYSWSRGEELLYLSQNITGTQFESGFRYTRSTNALPTSIVAPTLYPTNVMAARNLVASTAISHACTVPAFQWRPPFCKTQYRIAAFDGIGGFGSTNLFRGISADGVRYFKAGYSTIAIHASAVRTGGVLADSGLVCATVRGYPKPFCGTDSEGATAEWRIDDATANQRPLEWVLFTEDAASRVRGGTQSFALPYFTWHPDTGIGMIFRGGLRFDLATGQAGMRFTFELKGQLY